MDDTRRFPRWLVRLATVLAVVVLLGMLRTAVGLGAAFVHFRNTPDFEAFVEERAVPADIVEAWLPSGEVLASDEEWTAGEFDTPESEILMVATDVTIKHGSEVLLQTTVEFELAVDAESWIRRGCRIAVPAVQVRDGMHAVVQVGLGDVESLVEGNEPWQHKVVVDVLLVAGEGKNSFRVIELPESYEQLPGMDFADLALRGLLGLAYSWSELPEEGLVYQVRGSFKRSWFRSSSGSSGPGFLMSELRTNCDEYSYDVEIVQRSAPGKVGGSSSKRNWSLKYAWNDQVW